MKKLRVLYYPDPILKKKAEPLADFGPAMQDFFEDMIETMYAEDGVGLAAPQVGVSRRVLIASPTVKRGEEFVMVNPDILESSGREAGMEGCLSLPGVSGEIIRATKIKLKYQDRHGGTKNAEIKDFFARIVQHEIDHLNGILLIDRVDFNRRQEILAQYQLL